MVEELRRELMKEIEQCKYLIPPNIHMMHNGYAFTHIPEGIEPTKENILTIDNFAVVLTKINPEFPDNSISDCRTCLTLVVEIELGKIKESIENALLLDKSAWKVGH